MSSRSPHPPSPPPPSKKKFLRVNYAPYMTKRLRKAVVKISELKSKYLKLKTQESFKSYKKQ